MPASSRPGHCHLHVRPANRPAALPARPQFGTFVTAGSDGAYNFWDKDSKQVGLGDAGDSTPAAHLAPHPCSPPHRASCPAHAPLPQRLKAMAKSNAPIPCGTFNRDGTIYAYAVSYDWSRGYADYNPTTAKNYILLHSPQEVEVKSRSRTVARR